MAARRFLYFCVLAAAVAFYIAYQEWFSWLALLCLLGLPWFSLALSLPGILTFRAGTEGPEAIPLGRSGEIHLVGTSRFPVPPFRGRIGLRRCITGEAWQHKKETPLRADHCGGIAVTPERVWVCDYLGLFRFRAKRVEVRTVLVRPEPARMEELPDLERYRARSWRPKPGGGFSENHELRLYRPGDSLNQVHWKLTAKTGKLTIREPMEPNRGLVLLTMDISGSAEELDRKFGRLLTLGGHLLERNIKFELRVLTGEGILGIPVAAEGDLKAAIDRLLCAPPAGEGTIRDQEFAASWQHHIGGERYET